MHQSSSPTHEEYIRLLPTCELLRKLEFHGLDHLKAMLLVHRSPIDGSLDHHLHGCMSALQRRRTTERIKDLPQNPVHQQDPVPIARAWSRHHVSDTPDRPQGYQALFSPSAAYLSITCSLRTGGNKTHQPASPHTPSPPSPSAHSTAPTTPAQTPAPPHPSARFPPPPQHRKPRNADLRAR